MLLARAQIKDFVMGIRFMRIPVGQSRVARLLIQGIVFFIIMEMSTVGYINKDDCTSSLPVYVY